MKERDHRIELLRFLFSLIIVIFHAHRIGYSAHPIPLGYVFVEFFLYVQGYFLFRHVLQSGEGIHAQEAAAKSLIYTKNIFIKLFPYIIVCTCFQYLLAILSKDLTKSSLLFSLPYEIALLPVSGLHGNVLMTSYWYLSGVVLVLPAFSYFLYRCRNSVARAILPVLPILIYGGLCIKYGGVPIMWDSIEGIIIIFCRVIAGLAVGCVAAGIVDWLRKFTFTKFGESLLTLVEIGSFLLALCIAFFGKSDVWKTAVFTAFACLFVGLCILLSRQSLTRGFRFRPALFLGKLSVPLYLCHYNTSLLISKLMPAVPLLQKLVVYTVLSLIWAVILYYTAKLFPRLKALVIYETNSGENGAQ